MKVKKLLLRDPDRKKGLVDISSLCKSKYMIHGNWCDFKIHDNAKAYLVRGCGSGISDIFGTASY